MNSNKNSKLDIGTLLNRSAHSTGPRGGGRTSGRNNYISNSNRKLYKFNLIPNCISKPKGTTWICKCSKCIKCIHVLNILKGYGILIWRKGGGHRETRPIRGPVPPYPLGPPIGPPTAGPRKGYGIMHAHRICSPQDTATMQDGARMGNSGYVWTVYRQSSTHWADQSHCQDRHIGTCIHYHAQL